MESGLLLLLALHRMRAVRNSLRQRYCPRFSSDGGSDASTHLRRSGSQVTAKSGLTLLCGEQRLTSGIWLPIESKTGLPSLSIWKQSTLGCIATTLYSAVQPPSVRLRVALICVPGTFASTTNFTSLHSYAPS